MIGHVTTILHYGYSFNYITSLRSVQSYLGYFWDGISRQGEGNYKVVIGASLTGDSAPTSKVARLANILEPDKAVILIDS